jgi:hypothetical protein
MVKMIENEEYKSVKLLSRYLDAMSRCRRDKQKPDLFNFDLVAAFDEAEINLHFITYKHR